MSDKCRWYGCANRAVTRIAHETPTVGTADIPYCHEHAKRATGNDWRGGASDE
jgi:hypothetical protein